MEKYYVINENTEIDYTLFKEDTNEGTAYHLFHSDTPEWTEEVRGKLIMSAVDDGNDIKFSPKLKKTMDYAELFELNILVSFMRVGDTKKFPCKIIKADTITTI